MWDALRRALFTIKAWPYRWAGAVAVGAALVGVCLHLLFGLPTTVSVIISAVLGLLVLAATVLTVVMGLALVRFLTRLPEAPGSAPPGYVTPGNLPSAPDDSDSPDVQSSSSGEAEVVWE